MHGIAPSLAIEGVMKRERKALRAKSTDPPMPFRIFVHMVWVEFTVP